MPVEGDLERSADSRDAASKSPMPRIFVPEPDPASPSGRRHRGVFIWGIGALAAVGIVVLGLTVGRASRAASDGQPAVTAPDSAVPQAPPAAPAPSTAPIQSDPISARKSASRPPAPAPARPVPSRRVPQPAHPITARPKPVSITPAPPPPPPVETARLIVRSVPGGTLYVDDQLIGPAIEMVVPVAPGRHVVRVSKPGYRAYSKSVEVAAGEERRLMDVVLEPEK